jgi:dCMP deaminase
MATYCDGCGDRTGNYPRYVGDGGRLLCGVCALQGESIRFSDVPELLKLCREILAGDIPNRPKLIELLGRKPDPKPRTRPEWDTYFMVIADAVSLRMSCDRARIGAVVVSPDHRILSTGYGGAPSGLPSCDEVGHDLVEINGRQSCVRTIHAEKNAIITAARHGVRLEGSTLYTTASTCRDCFMAVLQVGIKRIVYGAVYVGGKQIDINDLASKYGIEVVHLPLERAITAWTPVPETVSTR